MPKKSPSKKPAPVPENPVRKDNGSSPLPKQTGNGIDEIISNKKRKNSEQEKANKQVEDKSAKANKLKKMKNKKIEAKEKEYLDPPTRPREKTGDGYFVYTAEELRLRKSDAGRLRKSDAERLRKSDARGTEENGETFNVRWNQEVDKCFLSMCIQEVTKKGRRGGSLHPESWTTIMEVLKETHNFAVSQKQMKNRYDYLKRKYQAWLTLKTSHVYDIVTNTINMKTSEWQGCIKAHPKAKSLKHAPLLYPELCTTLFEGTIITGADALGPNSKDQDLYITSTSDSENDAQLDNEDIEVDEHEHEHEDEGNSGNSNPSNSEDQVLCITYPSSKSRNIDQLEKEDIQVDEHERNSDPSSLGTHSKASIPPSQGDKPEEKKKCQPSSSQTKLEEMMASSSQTKLEEMMACALSFVMKIHHGPSVTDCISKLNEVGWDKEDDLYLLSAIVIFGSSAGHREAWMNLPTNNVRVLAGWVKKVGQIMGLKHME